MADGEGAVALALINQHMTDCTAAQVRQEAAIRDINMLLKWLMGGIATCVVVFAGYTYSQNQALHQDQMAATAAALAAVQSTAEAVSSKTVQKLNSQAAAKDN